jgi:hypothetical protein
MERNASEAQPELPGLRTKQLNFTHQQEPKAA